MAASDEREPVEDGEGRAWATFRRRRLREKRRAQCIDDPTRPGKRINPNPSCPHGTVGGHDNWGCQCAIVMGTEVRPWLTAGDVVPTERLFWPRPGCEPVKVRSVARARARAAARRVLELAFEEARRNVRAITTPPRGITLVPPPSDTPQGTHRNT